jgi:hypothetical protein
MMPGFEEALGLWERGELSRDELARRFPDEDIVGVLDAFDRMSAAAVGPAPDAGAAWEAVRAQLPVRLADRRRGRGKAIRLLAAAMIAVLTLGATAYAVVPGVRKAMNDAAGVITGDPDRSTDPTRHSQPTESVADGSTSESPDGDAAATDPDQGATGNNEAEAEANEADSDTDSSAGSDPGSNDDAIEDGSGSGTDDGSGSDDASIDDDPGSGEEHASDAVDGESSGSGSEDPES